jgi:serine/threonine protein kinase
MSGDSLRNYEIRQKLGSGSFGVVYKVVNRANQSVCVLKQVSLVRMSERARRSVRHS